MRLLWHGVSLREKSKMTYGGHYVLGCLVAVACCVFDLSSVLLVGKLPFEPTRLVDIIIQAAVPCLVAAAIVLPGDDCSSGGANAKVGSVDGRERLAGPDLGGFEGKHRTVNGMMNSAAQRYRSLAYAAASEVANG